MATAAPWAASANAVPWPMPLVAPVTSARRPSSSRAGGGMQAEVVFGHGPGLTPLSCPAMPYFKDAEDVYARLGKLFEDIIADEDLRAPSRAPHGVPVPDAPARLAGHGQGARGR